MSEKLEKIYEIAREIIDLFDDIDEKNLEAVWSGADDLFETLREAVEEYEREG